MAKDVNVRKSVLLVDNDETHLSITEMSLKDEFDVFIVKSGIEALEFLNKKHVMPDLIMLDILMPAVDGWIVFDKIGDIAALEFTPIVFHTSLDEEKAIEKAYELGASHFVTKPCKQSDLLSRIKSALHRAEQHKKHYGI